jgi:hypothetical protein
MCAVFRSKPQRKPCPNRVNIPASYREETGLPRKTSLGKHMYITSEARSLTRYSVGCCCKAMYINMKHQSMCIDGGCMNFDQYFVILGRGFCHILELKDIR